MKNMRDFLGLESGCFEFSLLSILLYFTYSLAEKDKVLKVNQPGSRGPIRTEFGHVLDLSKTESGSYLLLLRYRIRCRQNTHIPPARSLASS